MCAKYLSNIVIFSPEVRNLFDSSAEKLGLSDRVYHRLIKTARTIGELEEIVEVKQNHTLETIQYPPQKKVHR